MAGLIDSIEIEDQANLVVCQFALREEAKAKRSARKCGCRSCLSQLEDATDRVLWSSEMGPWHLSNRKTRRART